jgi:hypothetical protein
MTTARRIGVWHVPVGGQAPAEVPAHWVSALAAVSQDLQCRRYGTTISFDDVVWELTVHADGRRTLVPKIRDGAAVWVRPATDELVCRIGDLCHGHS